MNLPNIDFEVITYLFGLVLTALSVFWGINKAIMMAKTH